MLLKVRQGLAPLNAEAAGLLVEGKLSELELRIEKRHILSLLALPSLFDFKVLKER